MYIDREFLERKRKVQEMGGEAVAVETDITLGRNVPFVLYNRHGEA